MIPNTWAQQNDNNSNDNRNGNRNGNSNDNRNGNSNRNGKRATRGLPFISSISKAD